MSTLPMDHYCAWRDAHDALVLRVADLEAKMAAMQRQRYGRSSERVKVPSASREARPARTRAQAEKTRRERAEARAALPTETVEHAVAAHARSCPHCERPARPAGSRDHVEYDYVEGYFRRRVHRRETLACRCGYVVCAEAPARVFEGSDYGAGLIAHVVVAKCCDSIPLHRIERQMARHGVTVSRSTLTDLFHRAGQELRPLADAIVAEVARDAVVQADETPIRMQRRKAKGYLWTFLGSDLVAYRFSESRSGQTPRDVLGGTEGTLVVDAYTGYNAVTTPDGRVRAGCLAHLRRKLFEAMPTAPVAREGLDLIREVYRVEHEARERGVVRTPEHLAMRQARSRDAMEKLHTWMLAQRPHHLPKGPMGAALRYGLGQWTALTRFLDDARLPPDNNASERALRVAALGRKNFLFVGHKEAGENLAALYTLMASCAAHGVNPHAYLVDVLSRVGTHPANRIDELLPHRWQPLPIAA